jgi:hypothetical protein
VFGGPPEPPLNDGVRVPELGAAPSKSSTQNWVWAKLLLAVNNKRNARHKYVNVTFILLDFKAGNQVLLRCNKVD